MGIEKIAREGFDKELTDRIGRALNQTTKDIYSFFIHPVKITKKYVHAYRDMFREYYKKDCR